MDVAHTTKAETADTLLAEFLRSRQGYHDLRGRVLVQFLPMLEGVVSWAMGWLPPRTNRDELKSDLALEMLELLDRYDGRGTLVAYAQPRLRGAILNWAKRRQLARRELSLDQIVLESDA